LVKIPEVLDADPDPGSGNLFDSGSGIQDHQVKKVRKTLIPTFVDLYELKGTGTSLAGIGAKFLPNHKASYKKNS
jgi:hypothetical protein